MGELTPAVLWNPKVRYKYLVNSSNTSLRPDIEIHHLLLYTGRKVWVGKSSFLAIWSHGAHWLTRAPSPANSQCEDRFTEWSFHEHFINFIVADDQVCNYQLSPVHGIALYVPQKTIYYRTYFVLILFSSDFSYSASKFVYIKQPIMTYNAQWHLLEISIHIEVGNEASPHMS